MQKASISCKSFKLGVLMAALVTVASCSSKHAVQEAVPQQRISEEELRAYCPAVTVDNNGAFFTTHTRRGDDSPEQIVYQAVFGDMTRVCNYPDPNMTMKVAAAGRIVPGPQFKAGSITLPIRVTATRGTDVVYSKLHKYTVKISDPTQATQFIFTDDQISMLRPTQKNVRVTIGFERTTKK